MSNTETTIDHPNDAVALAPRTDSAVMPGFNSAGGWELAQRIGNAFAASSLVPEQYRGKLANCIVALEMANRMGASPLMVMQNLYIVHGNPGWSAKFLIACFNQCGRFTALRYQWNEERTSCRAWAIEKATGERIDGPTVTVQMAREEGWSTKAGSKWKTMPELMLMYRSAAFLIRTYAPEISMGLATEDEIIDTVEMARPANSVDAVRAAIGNTSRPAAAPAPAAAQPPAFDLAAWQKRIADCNDPAVLVVIGDDAEQLPEGPDRDAVLDALRERDAAIGI